MEIIKTIINGNNKIEDTIKVDNGNYFHKQIEQRGNQIFMRAKSRRIFEVNEA